MLQLVALRQQAGVTHLGRATAALCYHILLEQATPSCMAVIKSLRECGLP